LIEYLLIGIYVLSCFILILFVLLQPGKSDASAIFGGGASSTAFGPRGTQTVLAKVTVGAAIVFFVVAFLFSIPGLFQKKSLGQGITNSPVSQQPPPSVPAQGSVPLASPETPALPGAAATPAPSSSAAPVAPKPEASKAAAGNGGASGNPAAPADGNAAANQKKPEKK
jgi:preprotein translocase subunit SecG